MVAQSNTEYLSKKCIVCGARFRYPANTFYIPETCKTFECLYKLNHLKAMKTQDSLRGQVDNNDH